MRTVRILGLAALVVALAMTAFLAARPAAAANRMATLPGEKVTGQFSLFLPATLSSDQNAPL